MALPAALGRLDAVRVRLEQVVAREPAIPDEVASAMARAAEAITRPPATLATIGIEGTGKSTVLNAILGIDLLPTDPIHPATAAPVGMAWTDGAPRYRVWTGKARRKQRAAPWVPSAAVFEADWRCSGEHPVDVAELFLERPAALADWLMQTSNPGNERGVLLGLINFDHELLATGVRLLDLPGLQGVAPTIGEVTERIVRTRPVDVLAVIRDRDFRQLGPLLDKVRRTGNAVVGVMLNHGSHRWRGDDAAQRTWMQQARDDAVASVADAKGRPIVDRDQVYVLHVPWLLEWRAGHTDPAETAVHRLEAERFIDAVSAYTRRHGEQGRWTEATRILRAAVAQHRIWLAHREASMLGLDPGAAGEEARVAAAVTGQTFAQASMKGRGGGSLDLAEAWPEHRLRMLAEVRAALTDRFEDADDEWDAILRRQRSRAHARITAFRSRHAGEPIRGEQRARELLDRLDESMNEAIAELPKLWAQWVEKIAAEAGVVVQPYFQALYLRFPILLPRPSTTRITWPATPSFRWRGRNPESDGMLSWLPFYDWHDAVWAALEKYDADLNAWNFDGTNLRTRVREARREIMDALMQRVERSLRPLGEVIRKPGDRTKQLAWALGQVRDSLAELDAVQGELDASGKSSTTR
jgi:hypothetical protein